jgi:hypothetical protein
VEGGRGSGIALHSLAAAFLRGIRDAAGIIMCDQDLLCHRAPVTRQDQCSADCVCQDWGDQKRSKSRAYTQSLATGAPYPDFTLTGTSTLHTYHSATAHFLCSWRTAMTSPRHCALIEYDRGSSGVRAGPAIASQSGRLSSAAEHRERERCDFTHPGCFARR